MILEVTELGRLKHAKIDLSKRLIVFTGENNTGKTYLSYLIHGLGSSDLKERIIPLSSITNALNGFFEKKVFDFDAIAFYKQNAEDLYLRFADALLSYLPDLLALPTDKTAKTTIQLYWNNENDLISYFKSFADDPTTLIKFKDAELLKSKELNTGAYRVELTGISNEAINRYKIFNFQDFIAKMLLGEFIPLRVRCSIPAERIGISIFGKEIFQNRYQLTNQMRKLDDRELRSFLNRYTNLYPKAIEDALVEFRELNIKASITSGEESFRMLADELEQKILGGKLETNESDDIFFNSNNQKLSIQTAGSTVKSLSSLVFMLRHTYLEGGTIIMDEPEVNLHPDNQRKVARILAKLVNLGVQVIISTHSDYILRELNSLIMLGHETESSKMLRSKYNYEESELLHQNQVGAYLFKRDAEGVASTAEEIPINESGIQVETINAVINQQNAISHDIYFTLMEEKDKQ